MLMFLLITVLVLLLLIFSIFVRGLAAVSRVWRNVFPKRRDTDTVDEQKRRTSSFSPQGGTASSSPDDAPRIIYDGQASPSGPVVRDMGIVKDVDYEKVDE